MLLTHRDSRNNYHYIAGLPDDHLINLTKFHTRKLQSLTVQLDGLLQAPTTTPSRYGEIQTSKISGIEARNKLREQITILTVLVSVYIVELQIRNRTEGLEAMLALQILMGRTSAVLDKPTKEHCDTYDLFDILNEMDSYSSMSRDVPPDVEYHRDVLGFDDEGM